MKKCDKLNYSDEINCKNTSIFNFRVISCIRLDLMCSLKGKKKVSSTLKKIKKTKKNYEKQEYL